MHTIDGQERPVAYASRTLTSAERNYAQIEREALAIVFAVRKFHQYLYGRQFTLVTDHRPLCKLLGSNQGVPSLAAARMQRWALILSAYQYVLEYTPGSQNECADCLSRLPLPSSQGDAAERMSSIHAMDLQPLPVTAKEVARATLKDTLLAGVLQRVKHGQWGNTPSPLYDPFYRRRSELSCQDNCVLWGQRVIVPTSLQAQLLKELHEGHIGIARMKALARSYFWWPKLDQQIEALAAQCDACKSTVSMPVQAPRHPWQNPNTPWDRIHMDFGEYNSKHFLVVIDAYSKWPEVRLMSSTSASCLVGVLKDIFACHGFPRLVVSDNGPQFVSHELREYLTAHHILHHRSAPYHPATNGLAEGMVKILKQWLRKQASCPSINSNLADFLFTYRNVPHTTTGHSPAELIFGGMPRTHLSMLLPSTAERVKASLQPPENRLPPRKFKQGQSVWVRDYRPNAVHKWIKAVIESVNGPLNYNVLLDNGSSRRVHVDHIMRRPEPSASASKASSTSRSPEELVDTVVQSSPVESDPLAFAPNTLEVPATTSQQEPTPGDAQPSITNNESSLRESIPSSVTPPQVRRSSRLVRAPMRLIEEI